MKVSVSIVSYNNKKNIDDVLLSLKNSTIANDMTIYVVDNASSDGTSEYIEQKYEDVIIINLEENRGYGAGHNRAIKLVSSEYHFVINPDIKFEPKLIENMVAILSKNEDIALAIPKVKGYHMQKNVVPRRLPTIRRLLSSFLGEKNRILKKWRDDYYMVDADMTKIFDIEICSGCFMALRTKPLKLINGFDEQFFLYFEDFDLSRRIKEFGRVVCVPQLSVMHEAQREGHKNKKSLIYLIKSMCKYFNKWGWKF